MKRFMSFLLALLMILTACGASSPAANSGFSDVPADAGYAQAVEWCRENGILNGVGDGLFAPEGALTRAMLVTALYRAAGEPAVGGAPAFTDTEPGVWYSNAVAWANENGIVRGYGNGLFGTDDPVSVEDLEVIMGRYLGDGPEWTGDPARAHAATRAQVAVALYEKMSLEEERTKMRKITLTFNGHTYPATLADNSSAAAFAELLKGGPLTVSTHDYGNFEKVGDLGTDLPRNDEPITTSPGDIILYQGDQITIYYAQNSWTFTRLGRIDDPSGLREALGGGNVEITFQLADSGM